MRSCLCTFYLSWFTAKMHSFYFSVIVDKIDVNKDLFVNLSELKNWIQFTQRRYLEEDVDRQWRQHNQNNSEQVHWEVSFSSLQLLWFYYHHHSRMVS